MTIARMAGGLLGLLLAAYSVAGGSAQTLGEAGPDKDFLVKATYSNQIGIETSRLALDKATRDDVRAFARHVIDEHTKASVALKAAARASEQPELAETLDGSHQSLLDSLSGRSGIDFDKAYIDQQVSLHDEAVTVLAEYASKGGAAALKRYAETMVPVETAHRDRIIAIARPGG